ncbi:MAG: hypothetical protein U5M50_09755 [Sphingobium sp.]|nr:hypothetical protein [Sphingobium sp.]
MPRSIPALLLTGVIMLAALPTQAQQPSAARCEAPAILPKGFESWQAPVPLAAASGTADVAGAAIAPGVSARLTLKANAALQLAAPPGKPATTDSFGGMMRFHVDRAGTWQVALGGPAWLDIVQDGVVAPSVAHGHGPDCTGIRKIVSYTLQPGDYVLQLVGSGTPEMTALLLPVD